MTRSATSRLRGTGIMSKYFLLYLLLWAFTNICFGKPASRHYFNCDKERNAVNTNNCKSFGIDTNCWGALDTTFSNGDYIKYIVSDGRMVVELKIDNKIMRLPDTLTCDIPPAMVPIAYYHKNNELFLVKGRAFTFRQIYVCEIIRNKIVINLFETDRDTQADNVDKYVYKLRSDRSHIYLSDVHTSYKGNRKYAPQKILLPEKYQSEKLTETDLFATYIILHFASGVNYKIKGIFKK